MDNRISSRRSCVLLRLILPFFLTLFLLTLTAGAATVAVVNGDFSIENSSDPNFGWTLRGAAYVEDGKLKLSEGGTVYAEALQDINIPAGTSTLSFSLTKIDLKQNTQGPPDAFVVYLEDSTTGGRLLEKIVSDDDNSTAIFRFQQTGEVYYSPSVTVPNATASGAAWSVPSTPVQVTVDVESITGADVKAKVVLMLIVFEGGSSQVEIDNFQTVAAPVAHDDVLSATEDGTTSLDVLANDTDLNGNGTIDPATVQLKSTPAHGSGTVQTDGKVLYTPAPNYWGVDSFTYTVEDVDGNLSNTATVTVNVSPVNDAPVANGDTLTATEDTPATYAAAALVGNDADVDGDTLTVAGVTSGAGGTAALNGDGTVTFTPGLNFNGAASFTYTASDGSAASNAATVTVNVSAVNDAPVANGDTLTATEDTPATYAAAAFVGNDADADGDTLTVAGVTSGAGGTAALNGDGTVTFTPGLNFNGAASFTYTASDGSAESNAATVTVNVSPVNDAPVADAGPDQTVREATVVTLDGSKSTDIDDVNLTYSWTQTGGASSVTLSDPSVVKPTFTAPEASSAGDTLRFRLTVENSDGLESSDEIDVRIDDYVIPSDVNDDKKVDLVDAIILLRVMTRLPIPGVSLAPAADANGDGFLGLPEALHALQTLAELR